MLIPLFMEFNFTTVYHTRQHPLKPIGEHWAEELRLPDLNAVTRHLHKGAVYRPRQATYIVVYELVWQTNIGTELPNKLHKERHRVPIRPLWINWNILLTIRKVN